MSEVFLPPFVINDLNPVLPQSQTENWGFSYLDIKLLHEAGLTGKGIKVAVIDTGVDSYHPDLKNAVSVYNTTDEPFAVSHGHGTGVAGLIGARNNDGGIIGVAPDCQIIAIKALKENGGGTLKAIVDAIHLAKKLNVNVINLSLGTSSNNMELKRAIDSAVQNNILVICSAGNSGTDNSVVYPAKYNNTFAIGAINKQGYASAFSSRGWEVDVSAPGEKILTTWKNNSYVKVSGTSFSAPIVSGVAALLLEAGIKLTHKMLEETSIDIEEEGEDVKTGHGVINPYKLYWDYQPKPGTGEGGDLNELVKAFDMIQEVNKIIEKYILEEAPHEG